MRLCKEIWLFIDNLLHMFYFLCAVLKTSEEKFVNKTYCPPSRSGAQNRSLEESLIFFSGTLHVFE